MKKILILILVIIIIIGGIFAYKHFNNKDSELKEIETNQLIPVSPTSKDDYFLMYIDELTKDDSSIAVKGTIARGNIKVNEKISIVGLDKKEVVTKISKIKINDEEKDTAKEGDIINLVLGSDVPNDYITMGQAVIKTGTTKPIYNITAKINSISTDNISELEKKAIIFSINTDLKCSVKLLSEENNEIEITLDIPIVIDEGIEFSLKNGNNVVAKGIALK